MRAAHVLNRVSLLLAGLCAGAPLVGCSDVQPESDTAYAIETLEPQTDIGDDEVWVVMQSHLHTTGQHSCANDPLDPDEECYSPDGIEGFLDAALDYGASDMLITDHNNIDAWFDPKFAPKASAEGDRYATPLRGTEWSSGEGHLTLFFPRQVVNSNKQAFDEGWMWAGGNHSDDPTSDEYTDTIEMVHERGGLVVINHPELLIHPFDEATYGADAVEVGVKLSAFQSTSATRLWWHRRLLEGDRVTATAGSDHHHGGGDMPFLKSPIFGVAVNLVRVDTALPHYEHAFEAVEDPQTTIDMQSDRAADAIKRGHIMVVEDLDTPRVYIGADLDGDGYYHDARAGDCIPQDYDRGELKLRVRVKQPDLEGISGHYNVKFYGEARSDRSLFYVELDPQRGFAESKHYRIDPNDPFAVELTIPIGEEPGFIRVELEKDLFGPLNDIKTVTNPIYYGDWGAECTSSKPL